MVGMFKAILKNPKNTCYDGMDKDEAVQYVFRKSLLTTIPWLFATLLFFCLPTFLYNFLKYDFLKTDPTSLPPFAQALELFWYLFTFGFFFQSFLNWFFNVYVVTNKKIVDVDFHGLIYGNISEASLLDIEDVTSKVAGTLRVFFNFGDVFIQTAAEAKEFEFHDVPRPAEIRDLISDLVLKHKTSDGD